MNRLTGGLLVLLALVFLGLAAGSPAPDFTALNQDGHEVHLAALKGHFVLLYFYPKDETAGCTLEAQTFRDQFTKLKKLNALVFGVSRQDAASHKQFAQKNALPFDLLVDTDGTIGKAYGIPVRPFAGTFERQSVLIGPDGNVLKVYSHVDPAGHAAEVEADIRNSRKAGAK